MRSGKPARNRRTSRTGAHPPRAKAESCGSPHSSLRKDSTTADRSLAMRSACTMSLTPRSHAKLESQPIAASSTAMDGTPERCSLSQASASQPVGLPSRWTIPIAALPGAIAARKSSYAFASFNTHRCARPRTRNALAKPLLLSKTTTIGQCIALLLLVSLELRIRFLGRVFEFLGWFAFDNPEYLHAAIKPRTRDV